MCLSIDALTFTFAAFVILSALMLFLVAFRSAAMRTIWALCLLAVAFAAVMPRTEATLPDAQLMAAFQRDQFNV